MKTQIVDLESLSTKIRTTLGPRQMRKPARLLLADGESSNTITDLEVTEEPFWQHKHLPDVCGYPSELRRKYGDLDPNQYEEVEPAGTVLLHARQLLAVLFIIIAALINGQCQLKVHVPCVVLCAAGTSEPGGWCNSTAVYATGASHSYAWQCSDGTQGNDTAMHVAGAPGVFTYTFFAVCEGPEGPSLVNGIGTVSVVICSEGEVTVGLDEQRPGRALEPEYYDLMGNRIERPSTGLYIERRGRQVKKVYIQP